MTIKERYERILSYFEENQPVASTELHFSSPYELLVAVILSAQCTDKRVNLISGPFFSRFPDVDALASAREEEIFDLIKSCSYPNNKTKNLLGMARGLRDDFAGIVPADVDLLQRLPGVGRKTANVIASVVYDLPAMAVDTHVFRVSARLGLTRQAKNPLQAEIQLVRHIPQKKIPTAHHWLILHGRYVCQARKPKCESCGLKGFCKYYEEGSSVKAGSSIVNAKRKSKK